MDPSKGAMREMDSGLFAGAHVRLRGRRLVFLLDLPRNAEQLRNVRDARPLDCDDPIPDQQRVVGPGNVLRIGGAAEAIATRRALVTFARLRSAHPYGHSVRQIQVASAAAFKVSVTQMLGRSRCPGIARVRQIAMMLATMVCSCSRAEIGRRFDRNRATVWFAENKFTYLLDSARSSTIR
jgi:hypothetical protein